MVLLENNGVLPLSEDTDKIADIPFWVTMKALVKNKYWIYNIIICLSINFLMGATGSTTAYYMTYVVGDTAFFQIFSTVNTLSVLAAMLAGFGVVAYEEKNK